MYIYNRDREESSGEEGKGVCQGMSVLDSESGFVGERERATVDSFHFNIYFILVTYWVYDGSASLGSRNGCKYVHTYSTLRYK